MSTGDSEGPAWNKFWMSLENDTQCSSGSDYISFRINPLVYRICLAVGEVGAYYGARGGQRSWFVRLRLVSTDEFVALSSETTVVHRPRPQVRRIGHQPRELEIPHVGNFQIISKHH